MPSLYKLVSKYIEATFTRCEFFNQYKPFRRCTLVNANNIKCIGRNYIPRPMASDPFMRRKRLHVSTNILIYITKELLK